MHCVWQKLMNDGLSKESIDLIMSSWRSNTLKKYNTCVKQWIELFEKSNRDFQNPTIKDGLDFLGFFLTQQELLNHVEWKCVGINTWNNVEFGKQQILQKYERNNSLTTKLSQVYIHMGCQKFIRVL